ncbi:RNA-guided endonuclease TnpB family protein [Saccharopolyspora sp. NPDC050389]|uniref:RNA-guided endonuclease TnpB family protein n=1 Tax=Saccharopolyspora sp. NPDC050389 TaxID=3155516 RepID=UPI003405D59F
MKANTAMKFRLYPNAVQAERLTSWSHTCRAVWNIALAQRIWAYRSTQRVTLRSVDQCAGLTEARKEHAWLKDLPAQCAQQVLRQLDTAYDNFWNPNHPAGFPQFKRKHHRQGVTFPGQAVQVRRVSRRMAQVRLPKIGWVRFRLSRPIGGTIRNAAVTHDGLGWHVAFGIHQSEPEQAPVNTAPPAGVDMGIACSVFVSTEDAARQRPDTLTPSERQRLNRLEQRKARQIKFAKKHNGGRYSTRLCRTIAAIAAVKARQARRRADWNHKLTTDLAKNHGLVAVENLNVSSMVRSARGPVEQPGANVRQKAGMNRSIADQGWFEIRRQLSYKTKRRGGELVAVPAPGSSQTCSKCHTRDPESREGCGRLFACVHCGHTEHADLNAAIIILDRALSTAGRKPTLAWEAGASTSGSAGSQSTRSPHRGRGTRTGSRMREPSFLSPHHDRKDPHPSGRGGRQSKANSWHTDVTFVDRIPAISLLRAIRLPSYGGTTTCTVAAYEKLPDSLRALVDSLWAVHTNAYDYAASIDETRIGGVDVKFQQYRQEFVSDVYETEHPVVRVHPETGERALLLGHFVKRLVGLTSAESQTLFQLLQNRVIQLENTVRWNWSDGDLAIWDNRATQHYAIADYDDQPRRLHRVTLAGDVPVSIDGVRSTTRSGDASHYSQLAR